MQNNHFIVHQLFHLLQMEPIFNSPLLLHRFMMQPTTEDKLESVQGHVEGCPATQAWHPHNQMKRMYQFVMMLEATICLMAISCRYSSLVLSW